MTRWEYCFVPKVASGPHGTRDATLAGDINKLAALGWRAVHFRDSGAFMERELQAPASKAWTGTPADFGADVRDNTG